MMINQLEYGEQVGTVAQRLDKAWLIYTSKEATVEAKMDALNFMIYIFDLSELSLTLSENKSNLNDLLFEMMKERESKKIDNPEYVPIINSGRYLLYYYARLLDYAVSKDEIANDAFLKRALKIGHLLDVNPSDKVSDFDSEFGVDYLNKEQRIKYDVTIHNGLFYQNGQLFDSTEKIAHDKKSYVAYTLNANGQLSCFEHLYGLVNDDYQSISHSSINAGAPVLSAGEMEIKQGKLISINTFSGHYNPSLHSLVNFLDYLSERGVDISATYVYIQSSLNTQQLGVQVTPVVLGDNDRWYRLSAADLVISLKSILKKNIDSLEEYMNSPETLKKLKKLKKLESINSIPKVEIAKQFQNDLMIFVYSLENPKSLNELTLMLKLFENTIELYQQELRHLRLNKGRLDQQLMNMKNEIGTVREKTKDFSDYGSKNRIKNLKKMY